MHWTGERREEARYVAIAILIFIGSDRLRLARFLNSTGFRPETIREASKSPIFLLSVLDYASTEPELVAALAQAGIVQPEDVKMAQMIMSVPKKPLRELSCDEPSASVTIPKVGVLPRRAMYH